MFLDFSRNFLHEKREILLPIGCHHQYLRFCKVDGGFGKCIFFGRFHRILDSAYDVFLTSSLLFSCDQSMILLIFPGCIGLIDACILQSEDVWMSALRNFVAHWWIGLFFPMSGILWRNVCHFSILGIFVFLLTLYPVVRIRIFEKWKLFVLKRIDDEDCDGLYKKTVLPFGRRSGMG